MRIVVTTLVTSQVEKETSVYNDFRCYLLLSRSQTSRLAS